MIDFNLQNGDCLELMKNIPDKSVDMILCDLPYGTTACKWDTVIPFDKLWKQYNRIIKDNGCIALFGQGMFYIDIVNSNRKMFRYDLIWNKVLSTGFFNAKKMPLRLHEQIAIFYKNPPIYNPQYTIGKPNHSRGNIGNTIYKDTSYGNYKSTQTIITKNKYPTSILTFSKPHPSTALHNSEKPIALLEWLVKTYTNENDIVLDNCMGSGSTGVACKHTNRGFIGIELNPEYFELAKSRIASE